MLRSHVIKEHYIVGKGAGAGAGAGAGGEI